MQFEALHAYLPPICQELIELVGLSATEQLIKKFGGVTLIFSYAPYFTPVKAELGLDTALKLRTYFGSEAVYIPRCDVALRLVRNHKFVAEFRSLTDNHMTARSAMLQLCPKYGFSDRYGWQILRDAAQSQAQQAHLF